MPSRYYSAIAQDTTLSTNITNSSTSMTVGATVGYPSTPFVVAVDYNAAAEELVLVTGVSGTTFNITRGYNGTTAVAHATGAVIRHVVTAQDLTDAQNHYDATTSIHGIADTSLLAVNLTLNAQTGTAYTLVASDASKLVTLNNASAITLTIPSGIFIVGQVINIQQIGAGQVTVVGSGTTFTGTGTALRNQYSAASIICTGTNTFTLIGDIQ